MVPQPVPKPKPARVLIIEDEALLRSIVAEALREVGVTVIEAKNADIAKAFLDTGSHVDLIFSDVRTSGSMNGLGLAHYARAEHPGVPIILTSSSDIGPDQINGVGGFLLKPYKLSHTERVNDFETADVSI